MARFDSPLRRVRVAAPCMADWDRMRGDERVRFCDQCSLNVYNLSGMTRREAEAILTNSEGRLCVRFYRRADGTILTNNCPVGLRALKRRVSRVASATLSAVVSFFAGLGIVSGLDSNRSPIMGVTTGSLEVNSEPSEMGVRVVEIAPAEVVRDSGWVAGRMSVAPRHVSGRAKPVRR